MSRLIRRIARVIRPRLAALAASAALAVAAGARAENWPQWRGPAFNGSTTETHLPDELTEKTLAWKCPLPGPSAATPAIWNDKVFISSTEEKTGKLFAMCIGRADGKVLWQKEIAISAANKNGNNMATPSPITDGKSVWFYYGTGDLNCFDLDGNPRWARNIQTDFGKFNILWLYGSSPLLFNNTLYVQVLQRDTSVNGRGGNAAGAKPAESYLLAIDPATGKDKWRIVRTNNAIQESKESYATPMPFAHDGKTDIVLVGGDCVTGHDPDSGKELWRRGGWNTDKITSWRLVPSVVSGNGIVLVCPPKGAKAFGVAPYAGKETGETARAWIANDFSSDVCVPLFYKDKFYFVDGDFHKGIGIMDPATGNKVSWTGVKSGPPLRASPLGADNKIYFSSEAGEVWVVSADDLKVISTSKLGKGPARASIVAAQGMVFVRTATDLSAFAIKN